MNSDHDMMDDTAKFSIENFARIRDRAVECAAGCRGDCAQGTRPCRIAPGYEASACSGIEADPSYAPGRALMGRVGPNESWILNTGKKYGLAVVACIVALGYALAKN